jgi:signal transduction histidine kinase/ligand-binding sensor domain-containing protein
MKKILTLLWLFCYVGLSAQYKKPFLNNINVLAGLPEPYVIASLQDHYGYMWLGTQNGIVRYDGYNLKPYAVYDTTDKPLVIHSAVYFYEDKQNTLWTYILHEGFFYLDQDKNAFVKQRWKNSAMDALVKRYYFIDNWVEKDKGNEFIISVVNVTDSSYQLFYLNIKEKLMMLCPFSDGEIEYKSNNTKIDLKKDASGNIWLVRDSLLSRYNFAHRKFETYFKHPVKNASFGNLQVDSIDDRIVWLSSEKNKMDKKEIYNHDSIGLIALNTDSKQFKWYFPDNSAESEVNKPNANRVYSDELKRIWLESDGVISLFNRQNQTFKSFPLPLSLKNKIYHLYSDKKGNLWMSNSMSFYYLNIQTGIVNEYNHTNTTGSLPNDLSLMDLLMDKWGTLWITYEFSGINFLDRKKSIFTPTRFEINDNKPSVNSYSAPQKLKGHYKDSINFLVENNQLYSYDLFSNQYFKINLKNDKVYDNISVVKKDNKNNLWISTYRLGLFKYDLRTGVVQQFTSTESNEGTLSSNSIMYFEIDKNGILWLGTTRGLCSFDPSAHKATRYPFISNNSVTPTANTLDDRVVVSMTFDSDGILWIGTNQGGLNRFDPTTKKFFSYLNRKDGIVCPTSILEDSQKRLWFGTYLAGIFLLDKQTGTYKRFSEKDGLLGNTISHLGEDAAGNIVCFNERGIAILNPSTQKISTLKFTELNIKSAFTYGYVDSKKVFHFNNQEGISHFDLTKIIDDTIPPSVVIESLSYHTNQQIDTVIRFLDKKQLTLSHNENNLSFEFVAIQYSVSNQHQYAYKLNGFDKDWVHNGASRNATYTNLPPGTYTFVVKACNTDGVWNEEGTSFTFTILPPWWKTWWAYTLYIFITVGAIRLYIQYRSKTLRLQNQILEEKINDRTQQLQQSITELKSTQTQLIQSEKMASLGELTAGIAHEIQNPLNFVNNFSELSSELLEELKQELANGNFEDVNAISSDLQQNLEKINHHGKRADSIVKGMLMHSRTSKGQRELTNFNALIDEYMRLAYHGLRAKDKSFNATLKTEFDPSSDKINIVPQDIGRVILNLATNAFYATNEKKKQLQKIGDNHYIPTVAVSTQKHANEKNKIVLTVSDNGSGIPASVINKIFQPFFTTKPTGQGTGLGLSLVYDIIKTHNGVINVDSTDGEGTTFVIELPTA